jgi:hypothetical protein
VTLTTILSVPKTSPSPTALYVSSKITMETPALSELVLYLTEVCSFLEREMTYKYKLCEI